MDEDIRQLRDSECIRGLMARYARAVDRLDLASLRDVYHPDAVDDHGDYQGDVEGLLRYVEERTGDALQVMHFLGQCLIEFAGADVAVTETYFMTTHTLGRVGQQQYEVGDGDCPVQLSMFGRYVDRVERRAGEWRIARRVVVFEASRVFTGQAPALKPEWARLARDLHDPIYRMRADAGLVRAGRSDR